ncbi:MAG: hypothetical protein HY397_00565 [Candidatus Doudnabacteria bacterium]|nr:hypothetical protein [Candidatus Doudnabacteria bacterium]
MIMQSVGVSSKISNAIIFRWRGERGLTLIETIIALGLLTTGILGGLSLAIASIGASEDTLLRIVATNLAREGIEVIRMTRDNNWHNGTLVNCDADFGTSNNQLCIRTWDNNIPGSATGVNYRADFNPVSNAWSVTNNPTGSQTRIFLRSDGVYSHSGPGTWRYSRQITITRDTAAPFSATNPRLYVLSTVWWSGKRCPATDNPLATTCKLSVEEYLTNWRNF